MYFTAFGHGVCTLLSLCALAPSLSYSSSIILLFVGTAVNGLMGGYGTFLTGIYAYAADLTKKRPQDRGAIFALILGSIAIGNTTGPLVSGLLLKAGGFGVPLTLQLVLCITTFLLLVFYVKESLDPADIPSEPFSPLRKHNTLVVLHQFLCTHQHESKRAGGGGGRSRVPPLLPLSACFCFAFSDLVGQGTMFLYYAKRVFNWKADVLG